MARNDTNRQASRLQKNFIATLLAYGVYEQRRRLPARFRGTMIIEHKIQQGGSHFRQILIVVVLWPDERTFRSSGAEQPGTSTKLLDHPLANVKHLVQHQELH